MWLLGRLIIIIIASGPDDDHITFSLTIIWLFGCGNLGAPSVKSYWLWIKSFHTQNVWWCFMLCILNMTTTSVSCKHFSFRHIPPKICHCAVCKTLADMLTRQFDPQQITCYMLSVSVPKSVLTIVLFSSLLKTIFIAFHVCSSGWWFGTFFIFPYIGIIIPTD